MYRSYPSYEFINFDALRYAGNPDNTADIVEAEKNTNRSRYSFVLGSITDTEAFLGSVERHRPDIIVHFAAESHVDRSIIDSAEFINSNVVGTHAVLEVARKKGIRLIHISTDEIYGDVPVGESTEESGIVPSNPYAASKAAADVLAQSYIRTYKAPITIIRGSNNYGPFQFPEKLIPLMITNALQDQPLPVYGDGQNIRDWLYVEDHCSAIDRVLTDGKAGEVYNIGGHNEWANIDIVKLILKELNKPETLIQYVTDRLGHDRRYAIDASKIEKELGWTPSMTFEVGIKKTIDWYLKKH